MKRALLVLVLLVLVAAAGLWFLLPTPGDPPTIEATGDPVKGEYVLRMAGCASCHTDAKNGGRPLAGGLALATPFGTFHAPNITPDPATGIGDWSTGGFVRAMKEGISPAGVHLYPAFPYTSYTNMTEQDIIDLKAYLDTVEPVVSDVPPHDLTFPFSLRPLLAIWKLMFFAPGEAAIDSSRPASWQRGAYLVNGPGHCGECHTPRNLLGAMDHDRQFAGTKDGPDGKSVPNITPHEDGISGWSPTDITYALQTAILPDGDVLGGSMGPVIEDNTSKLTADDRAAIAEYLLSLEPLPDSD